jgi:tetratricopeptide (TPR) repeat protein
MTDDFSQNAMYYTRSASLNITSKEYKNAMANIDKAIKIDSTFFDAYKDRLMLNIILGRARSTDDIHDRMIAKRLIEKQIRQNPEDKSLYIKRGELQLLMDDYDGALKDGLYVLKSNANIYSEYDLISTTYQKMGEWNKAIPYLKKMQELQPDNTLVSYNLAISYQNIQQFGPALDLLNGIIDRYPDEANYYLSRANLFMLKGDIQDAKADFEKAVSVDPENYKCYLERGFFLKNTSSSDRGKANFDKAIALLGDEIKKNPQDAPLLIHRAEIMEQTGNVQSALNEYESYLKIWPLNYSVLAKKAIILSSSRQWPQAIDAYNTIINNFPENATMFYNRSLTFQQAGNLQKALDDINNAIRIDQSKYSYYFHRSRIRYQLGDQTGYKSDLHASSALLNDLSKTRKLDKKEIEMLSMIQKLLNYTPKTR